MKTIHLSRQQYDRLTEALAACGDLLLAFQTARPKWSLAGVSVTTDNAGLVAAMEACK